MKYHWRERRKAAKLQDNCDLSHVQGALPNHKLANKLGTKGKY